MNSDFIKALEASKQVDLEEITKLLCEAAKKASDPNLPIEGIAYLQFQLGIHYAFGIGVTQNYKTAYAWFDIAAINGFKQAEAARDDVGKHLSQSDLDDAKCLVERCVNSGYKDCPCEE